MEQRLCRWLKRRLRPDTPGSGRSDLRRADQPSGSAGCEKCRPSRHTGTRHIEGQRPLGVAPDREALEQRTHRQRALVAEDWAKAMSTDTMNQPINHGPEPRVDISQGVQL